MSYRCVIFDLFDTLADFKRDLLPIIDINGEAIRSTTPVVYPLFAERYSHIPLATFYQAFRESFEEAARLREREEREVSAHERFRLFFQKLQIPITPETEPFLSSLLDAHMACLSEAVHAPEEHRELLEWLRPRYQLGLISNFDHAPTARRILDRAQLVPFFDLILISEDHGSRKPYPAIFEAACRALRIAPDEAIFIGDSPNIDVAGAKRIGMGAIWLNRTGDRLDESIPRPDHTVTSLEEIKAILE
ncbi:MAG: HAD family hydrolase [candidate division NC10 bacterium]|nr:HAD family hydrolase [candidate division NC10 bacterium]